MANSTTKAFALMQLLKSNLVFRFPSTYVFTDSLDANGCPVLTVSQDATPAAGEQVMVYRIKPVSLLFNAIGQTQEDFVPHDLDVCIETGAVANTSILNATNAAIMNTESAKTACIYKLYMCTNTTLPAVAEMTAANLKFTSEPMIYNKLMAQ